MKSAWNRLTVGAWLSVGVVLSAMAQGAPAVVGEVTLVIGVAAALGSDGAVRSLERGARVKVGDRIETQANGHVHLRFVDGGRLSVRPASRMYIESYSYAQHQPEQGAIKFRLEEGVVRSVTGGWGEAARDRFRLNTPVAAIGVKGTDFVVSANAEKTSAAVYTGAIMLAQLDALCRGSVGPCVNGSEKLLTDEMKGLMLELDRRQSLPRFVPAVDLLAMGRKMGAAGGPPLGGGKGGGAEAVVGGGRLPEAAGPTDKALVSEARGADVLAATAAVVGTPAVTELTWWRFAWAPRLEGDDFVRDFDAAMIAGTKQVGGTAYHNLRRPYPLNTSVFVPPEGKATFRLVDSAAGFMPAGSNTVQAANIDRASLTADFSNATFSTKLNVTNATVGAQTLSVDGAIRADGTFVVRQTDAIVTGAFSTSAKEAAYSFDKNLPAGLLMGLTRWGR